VVFCGFSLDWFGCGFSIGLVRFWTPLNYEHIKNLDVTSSINHHACIINSFRKTSKWNKNITTTTFSKTSLSSHVIKSYYIIKYNIWTQQLSNNHQIVIRLQIERHPNQSQHTSSDKTVNEEAPSFPSGNSPMQSNYFCTPSTHPYE